MADDDPLKSLPGVSDLITDMVGFSVAPWKWAVVRTFVAYGKQTIAGVGIAVPVMASAAPTIAQHVARKPDEHLSSNAQPSTVVQEGASEYVFSATSTSQSVVKVKSSGQVVFVIPSHRK